MAWIDSVSGSPAGSSNALSPQKPPNFAAELQAAEAMVFQTQTADIRIVTAEGDTINLSSSRSAELTFSTYNAEGKVGGSSVSISGISAEIHRESAFSISVDGDLNKEEIKDIRRAIRTLQKAAKDVFKGHEEKAASRTAKLANLDQIASIDADLEFNRQVSVTRISAQSESAELPESTEASSPAPDSEPELMESAKPVSPAATGITAEPPASTAAATTITAGTHFSFVLQTQNNAISASTADAPHSGLWWFPSADIWNTLHTEKKASETSAAA